MHGRYELSLASESRTVEKSANLTFEWWKMNLCWNYVDLHELTINALSSAALDNRCVKNSWKFLCNYKES